MFSLKRLCYAFILTCSCLVALLGNMNNASASDNYVDLSSSYSLDLPVNVNFNNVNVYDIDLEDIDIIENYMNNRGKYWVIVLKGNSNIFNQLLVYEYDTKPTYLTYNDSNYWLKSNIRCSRYYYFPYGSSPYSHNLDNYNIVISSMENNTFNGFISETGYNTYFFSGYDNAGVLYSTNIEGLKLRANGSYNKPILIDDDNIISPNDDIIFYKDYKGYSTPNYNIKEMFITNNSDNTLQERVVNQYIDIINEEDFQNTGKAFFKLEFLKKSEDEVSDVSISSIELLGSNNWGGGPDTDTYEAIDIPNVTLSDLKYTYKENRYIVTGKISIPAYTCNYKKLMLRTKFTSSQNTIIITYDTLLNSKWNMPADFLNNYIMYEFPANVTTAYVSGQDSNDFRIYTYNEYLHDNNMKIYNYNYVDNVIGTEIEPFTDIKAWIEDKNRRTNSTFIYYNTKLDYTSNNIAVINRYISDTTADNVIDRFWVPDSYTVSFTKPVGSNENITIVTPDGTATIGSDNSDSLISDIIEDYEEELNIRHDYSTIGGLFQNVKDWLEETKRYIKIYSDLIGYFFNNLNSTIKASIITLFIVIMVCTIIKLRK